MPVLTALSRELERLKDARERVEAELSSLPREYVSRKAIGGRVYFYLQHREGRSVKSQLIKKDALEEALALADRRRELKAQLRQLKREQARLQQQLKRELLFPSSRGAANH